jgi:uncharacterized protein (DUF2252 family)
MSTTILATAPPTPVQRTTGSPALGPAASARDRYRSGKQLRAQAPLESHAEVPAADTRPDPVALLERQAALRLPELAPIRYGRMAASPWTFYRGAARVMAGDLSRTPSSGIVTQLCGDAHLANFGLYGSAERRLVFDINDFDETFTGPWEWDVKRLAASVVVAARANGVRRKQRRRLVMSTVQRYRTAMARFAELGDLEVWYTSADAEQLQTRLAGELSARGREGFHTAITKAHSRDSSQALGRLAEVVDGRLQIRSDPPLVVPLRELMPRDDIADIQAEFEKLITQYRRTLQPDRRVLLERYTFVDMARKVVGVGSVGTRCWIVLLTGRDTSDPLFLQIKEAGRSVLSESLGRAYRGNEGQRVVLGQRLMQAASDIFLGWQSTAGLDGVKRDFYFRQLRDWKFSFPLEALAPEGLRVYAEVCAWSLARAHARSGDRVAIAGYLGSRDAFDDAIAMFAESYADLNEGDLGRLLEAISSGRVTAREGL